MRVKPAPLTVDVFVRDSSADFITPLRLVVFRREICRPPPCRLFFHGIYNVFTLSSALFRPYRALRDLFN